MLLIMFLLSRTSSLHHTSLIIPSCNNASLVIKNRPELNETSVECKYKSVASRGKSRHPCRSAGGSECDSSTNTCQPAGTPKPACISVIISFLMLCLHFGLASGHLGFLVFGKRCDMTNE